jgi:hypothetical protein
MDDAILIALMRAMEVELVGLRPEDESSSN